MFTITGWGSGKPTRGAPGTRVGDSTCYIKSKSFKDYQFVTAYAGVNYSAPSATFSVGYYDAA